MNETRDFLDRLHAQAIEPHAQRIAEIVADGGIAVVVFEPATGTAKVARKMGWNKYASPVVRMPEEFRRVMSFADTCTRRWLERSTDDAARILVLSGHGTLLLNLDERGFSFEPGSLDHERKALAS